MNQKLEEIKRLAEEVEKEHEAACKSLVIGEPGKQLLTREETHYERLFRVRTHQLATRCLRLAKALEKSTTVIEQGTLGTLELTYKNSRGQISMEVDCEQILKELTEILEGQR